MRAPKPSDIVELSGLVRVSSWWIGVNVVSSDGLDPSAEIAAQRLSELVAETCGVLKATLDGRAHVRKALEVSLKRRPFDRIFRRGSVRGGYTIIYGRPVWMLSSSADAVGINEDGGLGVTEDGELVVTSNWLTVRGEQPIDPNSVKSRRIRSRVASRVRKRGFDSAIAIAATIKAFGEPQMEQRFLIRNSEFRNAFYLDGSGNLVFGSPEGSVDAAHWFRAVVALKTGRENSGMTVAERTFFDKLRSKPRVVDPTTSSADAATRDVGIDDHNADGRMPGPHTGRLAFDAAMVNTVAQAMRGANGVTGSDISSSGSVSVRQFGSADPTEGGFGPDRLLDVVPVTVRSSATNVYSHWMQTRRDVRDPLELAAAEPEWDSDGRVTRVDKNLEALSHSSTVLDKAWLRDAADLERWLADEMIYRLRSAVEAKIVDDVRKVSSIQLVEFDTSALVSIRKGLTHLPVADWINAAVVVHPSDWETIELALVSTKHSVMPFEPAPRLLFGSPVIVSNAAVSGQALVLGRGAVGLSIDGSGIRVEWSSTSGAVVPEMVVGIHGNYQTDVYRPSAVVLVELA